MNIEKEVDELISKKELLSLTKISYGQLYRWKRMNIIPEDWFIKKSMPTGQETFFKREKILERIQTVLSMKDDVSLEEIAELFNKKETEKSISIQEIEEKSNISKMVLDVFASISDNKQLLGRSDLIIINIIEKYLVNSVITLDELKNLMHMLEVHFDKLYSAEGKIILYRKLGVAIVLGCKNEEDLIVDPGAIKIIEIDLQKEVSEMGRKFV